MHSPVRAHGACGAVTCEGYAPAAAAHGTAARGSIDCVRIGIVAPPWAPVPPTLYGGTEVVVDLLARGFQAAGHDVVLFTTGDSDCPVPRQWALEHSVGDRIGATDVELHHVLLAYEALDDCDVVHDHTIAGPMLAPRHAGQPVVTTSHLPFEGGLLDVYLRMPHDVRIVAISEAQRRPVPQLPVAGVIHHGIDAAGFPYRDRSDDYCLFLGRMAADKGVTTAIGAARKAGVPLVLAGKMRSPSELAYFEQQVQPLLGDEVVYHGEVAHPDKLELLRSARALLFPIGWNEPFGMVMLEAMACGTPVLATPFGAVPEVVQDGVTGFLCRDETQMAEAIGRVETLSRRAGRDAVEGYFSAERMVMDYLALFELVASAG